MKKVSLSLFSLGLAFISILSSCGSSQSQSSSVDTVTVQRTDLKVTIPYDSLRMPGKILITDNNILTLNSQVDTIIDRYTIEGKYLDAFLTLGQGPTDVNGMESIQYAQFDESLYITEQPWLPIKVVSDINSSFPVPTSIIRLEYTDSAFVQPSGQAIVLANGSIITKNSAAEGMLAVFGPDHKFVKLIQPYPPKSEFGEGFPDYAIFNFYQPFSTASPDGKHFVTAYTHGDILAFGCLDNDSVKADFQIKSAPEGVVPKTIGESAFSWVYNDRWFDTYGAPTLSNKYAYIPYYGTRIDNYKYWHQSPEGFTQEIRIYDFDGKHVRSIMIPDFITYSIAVTPDDKTLYILNEDSEEGYRILQLNL